MDPNAEVEALVKYAKGLLEITGDHAGEVQDELLLDPETYKIARLLPGGCSPFNAGLRLAESSDEHRAQLLPEFVHFDGLYTAAANEAAIASITDILDMGNDKHSEAPAAKQVFARIREIRTRPASPQ